MSHLGNRELENFKAKVRDVLKVPKAYYDTDATYNARMLAMEDERFERFSEMEKEIRMRMAKEIFSE